METTLNIRHDILMKINQASASYGVSRMKIIIALIKMTMDDSKRPFMLGSMVRYQERAGADEWHRFHLILRVDDYEYFLDLRKFLKMSVSKILAYSVEKYLGTIIKIFRTDNYRINNYILSRQVVDNIICWKIIWGYPSQLEAVGIQ